ncbi:GNAT family acetyltransferase [Natronomonas pharaonis DSM 2160]|uniref:GNAT family acetyltransferase n=1 Tax=Natronomonas pharaonis (strain ATCC 35678 / DSM 2160 / CIP 103997 / JCM 8858 / NBRC 14720 / NCIMB 2260 / Gabara) TaxID=348780 RepID=A0A1U7EWY8_NATPD|nr:GNAT family N-acetyltransferase [Natronomonas pharaonis]CAI49626.1 GNAT family acetyltransferase [Natronomonas pharaonis DSM 2160]
MDEIASPPVEEPTPPEDVSLRVATTRDAAAIADIYRPYIESTAATFREEPLEPSDVADEIDEPTYPWFVAERDGRVIGYAHAGELRKRAAYRWATELTVYLRESAHGAGVGSALYRLLLRTLARQGFVSAYGVVTLPNQSSVALHESLGFERNATFPAVGYKLGGWHDVAWYERQLRERPPEPSEPTPFEDCRSTPWLSALLGRDG